MNDTRPADLGRAPGPIRELADLLASRGTPLREEALSGAPRGDRTLHATTPIGIVRVWTNSGYWGVDVALPGVGGFVDADVWAACAEGRKLARFDQPPPKRAVAWVRSLLEAPSLPPYDADCLTRIAGERVAGQGPATGRTLAWLVVAHIVFVVVALWGAAAFDLAILRIMGSLGVVSLVVLLVRPALQRRRS
ncbi:hypothetical protein J4N02_00080 [Propioniciclava sp. MC1595]|uniref:hypothetical protein n=1 Tax=unclassified Propioniciclava TaxID=2642922 RepID=UPI001601A758|nr:MULTISPECIES: hypothetical protein [unclassified Propioniciclava]MBB1495666.1 hypothetical protein [Propioniciclava sp. MC1595]MBB1501902.1 hypothetical protein [Propioniciclava sp. MC1683]QTE26091.1 hypothetical protein J4N02_00080 [Propioniciclava sp. MC1595]